MNALWQNLQYKMLRSGSKLNLLIGINIIVFLLVNVSDTIGHILFRTEEIGLVRKRLPKTYRLSPQITFTVLDALHLHVYARNCMAYLIQHALAILVRADI